MGKRRVLSLIELLVIVIVIWAALQIIPAIIPPTPPSASSIVCRYNNLQLSKAVLLYAEEHDGSLFSLEDEQDKLWFDLLAPYLEHDKVMRCPKSRPNSDKIDDVIFGTRLRAWRVNGTEGGYAINGWLFTKGRLVEDNVAGADSEKLYGKLSGMDSPGEVPITGDSNWFVSWPRTTDTMPTDLERGTPPDAEPKNYMGRFCIARHDRGKHPIINLGFADGHAEKKRLDELWSLKWHRGFQTSKKPPGAE